MSLPSFPRSVPTSGAALCSVGSSRTSSPTSSLLPRRSDSSSPRPRSLCSRDRSRRRRGRRGLPGSWPTLHVRAVVHDPGEAEVAEVPSQAGSASWLSGVAFRAAHGVGLHHTCLSGLTPRPTHPLSTLHERAHARPCKTRFRLATSCPGRLGISPTGWCSKFPFISFLFDQAFLAHGPAHLNPP